MIPVLFLAWYFPPVGGAGVQRSLKFVRFLPDHGVRPLVLAGPAAQDSRWAPDDQSLAAEVPADLVVARPSPAPMPTRGQRLRWRVTGEQNAVREHWRRFALDQGPRLAAAHGARAIFVTLGPFECLHGALELGERLSLPVVADLRDPWAFDEMRAYGHRLQRHCDRARMLRQLARCRAVVMNTPTAQDLLRRHIALDPARVHCITNGYDAEDFAGPAPTAAGSAPFSIVHTGYLHCDAAQQQDARSPLRQLLLGGQRRDVDLWGRTHRYLLAALERLQTAEPALAARTELHLHGVLSAADLQGIERSPVRARVRTFGYRPHDETVQAMRRADLLFLPMQGLPKGQRATIVPGKTYEYLASQRPILAAVPAGDARDFVQQAAAGDPVAPHDVDGLFAALRTRIAAGRAPDRALGPAVQRFERRALTQQLADVLRAAAGA